MAAAAGHDYGKRDEAPRFIFRERQSPPQRSPAAPTVRAHRSPTRPAATACLNNRPGPRVREVGAEEAG